MPDNFFPRRIADAIQKSCRFHYLTRLAVATLRYLLLDPCLLHGVQASLATTDAFYGGDLLIGCRLNRRYACTDWLAVEMHRTGATLGDAATEFGAGESGMLTYDP